MFKKTAFTLIEIIIIVVIIGILFASLLPRVLRVKENAYLSTAKEDLGTMEKALQLYLMDNADVYPPDVARNIPVGLGPYVVGGTLARRPIAPWPNSIYDRDNILPVNITALPKTQYIQISIRFCPVSGPINKCKFPDQIWAAGFNINSAAYYCLQGPCRSHSNEIFTYPGKCLNC